MNLTWDGHYLSGRTAERVAVRVTITPTGLRIDGDGDSWWWPYEEMRQTQGMYAGEHVRLERGAEPAEAVVIPERGFLAALRAVAPEALHALPDATRRPRWRRLAALVAAALGVVAAAYLWVIPAMANAVAARVPAAWEAQLGDAVVASLLAGRDRCHDPELLAAVEGLVARLAAVPPASPYVFRVDVVDDSLVNAFAAPGGRIVVFRGLLARTTSPEELAGVLAHEMEHVTRRHGTRAVLREIPVRVFLTLMGGDVMGAREAANAVGTLGVLRYSRGDEAEADAGGLRRLAAAGMDPRGMVRAFQMLATEAPDVPRALEYLSTHPPTAERIERLEGLAAELGAPAAPLAVGDWAAITARCEAPGNG